MREKECGKAKEGIIIAVSKGTKNIKAKVINRRVVESFVYIENIKRNEE